MPTLTRRGGWIFAPQEIRKMRTFVIENAGHGPLARGSVEDAAAAWIDQHVCGGIAAFLTGERDLTE